MQQAEQALTALPPGRQEYQVVQAEIATNQGAVAIMAGDAVLAEALARRSLDVLPEQAMLTRQLANVVIGASMQMRGEYHAGVSRIKEVLVGSDLPAAVRSHSLHSFCLVRMMEGDLNGVIASALECLRTSEGSGNRWMQNHARHHLGVAHYLRNEIELAEPYLSALHNDRATSAPSYLAFGAFALALICASKHQWDQAQQVVESLSSQFDDINSRFAIEVTKAFSVELAIRRGDIAHAQQLSGQIDYGLRPPMWFFYVPQLTPLKLLWAESTPEGLASARVTLEALDERMAAIHRKAVRIDVLSLMALVCDAQGETTTACDKLAQALKLAEPGGFIRNFVDLGPPMADLLVRFQRRNQAITPEMQRHLERILAAFYSSRARDAGSFTRTIPAKSASVELLTPRELQILRLLATELSPHEIAGELVMSTSTVRTHIKNIYAKMAVHSRMEAVHRAGVLLLQ
jgi:LuxR family maltose regulon positive regulatory protein